MAMVAARDFMRFLWFFVLTFGFMLLMATGVLSIGHQESTAGEWMLTTMAPIEATGRLERIHILLNGERYALRVGMAKQGADTSIAPNGRWMVFPNQHNFAQLMRADVDGRHQMVILELERSPAYYDELIWSPDSDWIAVAYAPERTSSPRLILARADGQSPTALSAGGRKDQYVWSPNGEWLVYVSSFDYQEGSNFAIARTRPDGRDYERITNAELEFIAMPRITSDSEWVLFQGHSQGAWNIYRMNMASLEVELLAPQVQHGAFALSPHGEWVAYVSDTAGYAAVYRMRIDGTAVEQLTTEPGLRFGSVQWSPDGDTIFLSENDLIYRVAVETRQLDTIQVDKRPTGLEVLPIPNQEWRGWGVMVVGVGVVLAAVGSCKLRE